MEDLPYIVQSLTAEQIIQLAQKTGITEESVKEVLASANRNDFINLGLIELTPDVLIGFILCEQQSEGLL